jgi:argininosuccinate synthase
VLAYSGGLDTSVILRWLQDTYGCEVVTFTADLGQGEELEPARKKAEMMGIKEIYRRGPPRDLRARLRLPDVPRQRAL